MVYLNHALMLEMLVMLQLPGDVEGDVDSPGSDGEGRGDVALQRVAHHQQLVGLDIQLAAQVEELFLALVAGDLHVVEVWGQPAALQLVLLVEELALGEDD